MCKVIANADQKGGVGKSTISNFEAYELASKGKKVLLIDYDSQASQTNSFFGYKDSEFKNGSQHNICNIFKGKIVEPIVVTDTKEKIKFDFIPSNEELLDIIEGDDFKYDEKINALPNYIEKIKGNYDYIIIDCPPSFGINTKSAIVASDQIVVPIATKSVDEDGVKRFFQKANETIKNYGSNINKVIIVPTIYDARMGNARQVLSAIKLLPRFASLLSEFKSKNINVKTIEKIPYKVEVIDAPGQRMFLKEYIEEYVDTKNNSINKVVMALENIVIEIEE